MAIRFLKGLWSREDGASAVEFAFLATFLLVMMIGALDYGLAFNREMQMSTAVRAGTQFALARHPDIGPDASTSDALISVSEIRDQVALAAPFANDPNNQITVTMSCDCEDASSNPVTGVDCTSSAVLPASCVTVRTQYLTVGMSVPYTLLIDWPGFDSQFDIDTEHSIMIAKN